jgi:Aldose 1-epimerase
VAKTTGLVRRKGSGNWYFRQRWPKRFATSNTPAEIWISLETGKQSDARELLEEARAQPLMRPTTGDAILDVACFPLVPFSNRIADGNFSWEGQEIVLQPNFPGRAHRQLCRPHRPKLTRHCIPAPGINLPA